MSLPSTDQNVHHAVRALLARLDYQRGIYAEALIIAALAQLPESDDEACWPVSWELLHGGLCEEHRQPSEEAC